MLFRSFGRGLVEPVDDMEQPAWNQDLLDWLAADLVEHHYDLKHTIEVILTSNAYQLPAVPATESTAKDNFVFRGPLVRRLSAEQFLDALGEITGVWNGDGVAEIRPASEAKLDASLASTPGKPKWIWNTNSAASKAEATTIHFTKEFDLAFKPTEARITLTCDNAFTLKVNGTKVGDSKDYTKPKAFDLRKFLKTGRNTIDIDATNDPGAPGQANVDQVNPAGLIAYVRLRDKEQIHDFGTDSKWQWENSGTLIPAAELGSANIGPWGL